MHGVDHPGVSFEPRTAPRPDPAPAAVPRSELVLRRYAREGWLLVAIGVIIPGLAAVGARRGFKLMRRGRDNGRLLLAVGALVFVARLALLAATL